jgi:hypothetical protein
MTELSDKLKGVIISLIGVAGTITGIGLMLYNPNENSGYSGTIASLGCISCGIEYIKK